MKTSKIAITATSAALFAATGLFGAPLAGAAETADLGDQAELAVGNVVQGWTISDLKESTDVVSYPVRGTLWEATATSEALAGNVQPIVSNLNARTDSGETYRVLFQIASPQGISPAGLAQGQKSTGKVYFDVTGAAPDSVVYNDGQEDLLIWVQPAVEPAATGGTGAASVPAAPAGTAEGDAPAAVTEDEPESLTDDAPEALAEDAPEATGADPAATGRQGTPLPEDATAGEATPAPAAPAAATPAPEAPAATEAPAGTPHGPAAESATGSQGTPLPEQAPADDAVQGTPHGPAATPTPTAAPTA
ncbi:MPT63 family protein [[Mycobacterium] wendilense]|uniref:DUF1942 domain-containing protein n=1 Tax=[Mycobacterium] wendilense TaxID=3064284 RepID=A0ABN9NYK5_9MYCO|nr:DUF1942 domain-containing protein [Mycolicibacterium sp. MU0050]CAJ1582787.1 DUF1942 domain-containing protein [Mycolicibacterium sp. MU0050]